MIFSIRSAKDIHPVTCLLSAEGWKSTAGGVHELHYPTPCTMKCTEMVSIVMVHSFMNHHSLSKLTQMGFVLKKLIKYKNITETFISGLSKYKKANNLPIQYIYSIVWFTSYKLTKYSLRRKMNLRRNILIWLIS